MTPRRTARTAWRQFLPLLAVFYGTLLGCAPTREPLSAQEALNQGWMNYRLGEYADAIRHFNTALAGNDQRIPALYALAVAWDLRRPGEDRALAAQLYEQVIREAPSDPLAAWSALALARQKHLTPVGTEPDWPAVRVAYQAVMERYPSHPAAEEAAIYLYSTYLIRLDPQEAGTALAALTDFVARHPDSGFRSAAWSLIAACHEILGDPDRQVAALVQAFETREVDPINPFYDNSWRYWNLAAAAEFVAGDFDTARKYYSLLISEYPQDVRTYPSRQALARMDRIENELRRANADADTGRSAMEARP